MKLTFRPGSGGYGGRSLAGCVVIVSIYFSGTSSLAQPASSTGGAAADTAWEIVTVLLEPSPLVPPDPSDERSLTPQEQEISRLRLAAAQAKSFYTQYPSHARSADARKLELITALQSLQLGAPDTENYLIRAGTFRNDATNSPAARYEVALAMENLAQAQSPAGRINGRLLSARENLADRLHAEFGGTPEVLGLYINLILTVDSTDSDRIARKVQFLDLPQVFKNSARALAARSVNSGREIELTLATIDHEAIVFEAITDVTVVYFWSTDNIADLGLLSRFKGQLRSDVHWIYIGLGARYPDTNAVTAQAPFAGKHCFDLSSLDGAAAATLGAPQTPYVSIIGRNGRVLGSGPVEELPALLARAKR